MNPAGLTCPFSSALKEMPPTVIHSVIVSCAALPVARKLVTCILIVPPFPAVPMQTPALHVFAYGITIGALDADACAAPNATTPTTLTTAMSSPKNVFMLAMLPPFLSSQLSSPERGTGAERCQRWHPPKRSGCQHGVWPNPVGDVENGRRPRGSWTAAYSRLQCSRTASSSSATSTGLAR